MKSLTKHVQKERLSSFVVTVYSHGGSSVRQNPFFGISIHSGPRPRHHVRAVSHSRFGAISHGKYSLST